MPNEETVPAGPLLQDIRTVATGKISEEEIFHVPGAKVVIANYNAIITDFPELLEENFKQEYAAYWCKECKEKDINCTDAIDAWLIKNTAFVSEAQYRPNDVNSHIVGTPADIKAYRPEAYGRALIVPINNKITPSKRFVDIKGAGVACDAIPSNANYSNGLEYLGDAIADFFYSKLLDEIFDRESLGYRSVPVYAVLDLGFDIVGGWHGSAPAGLHVRRAHTREGNGHQLPLSGTDGERIRLHIELVLRSYGLTTAHRGTSYLVKKLEHEEIVQYGLKVLKRGAELVEDLEPREILKLTRIIELAQPTGQLECVNVQLANEYDWASKTAQIVDFGHISARATFKHPLAVPVRDAIMKIGRVISPLEDIYIQPNSKCAVDADLFNRLSVEAFSFFFAQKFRQGLFSSMRISNLLRKSLSRALLK